MRSVRPLTDQSANQERSVSERVGIAGTGAIACGLARTPSALRIGEVAAAWGRRERSVGRQVFNPVPKMDLIELAFPAAASGETRSRALALCEALGKTPVEVPDTAGFVVNRLLFP